jgi:hypothetical protein
MKNVVYIFGAGASKDFGLPLGTEIFKRDYELSQSDNKNVTALGFDKLIDEVENNLHLIFSGLPKNKEEFPPFEEILTFIWDLKRKERFDYKQNRYSSIFKTNGKKVFDAFVNFYAATFIGSSHLNTTNDNLKFLKLFIKSLDYKNEN